MIRDKIFRLNRHKYSLSSSDGSAGQKFLFSFSNIQALQVPKGWDKLTLSLVSSESGKTVRKSGKVQVKNGTCQWSETLSESIWISDVKSSTELDEYLCKFIVSTGLSRSTVLGETTINLAAFLCSESPTLVPLPLKNCNYGTVLQVEVTCLTPKIDLSEKCKNTQEHRHRHAGKPDGNSSHLSELSNRESCFSQSVSHYSFDSVDDSSSDQNGSNDIMGKQDSVESSDRVSNSPYSAQSSVKSVFSIQGPFTCEKQGKTQKSSQQNGCSLSESTPKEVGDPVVEELETAVRMWEQNARKLSLDLETSRKELSASRADCHKLSQEVERLKSLLEESTKNWGMASSNIRKELEGEIRFQKEQNEDLSMQLKKTQESNIMLISLLGEMEETVEKQKHELESISANKSDSECMNPKTDEESDEVSIIDQVSDGEVKTSCEFLSLQDSLRTSQGKILLLESTLEDMIMETEIEQDLCNRILKSCLIEFTLRLENKEQKIINLEAALSQALGDVNSKQSEQSNHANTSQEIELPNVKVRELKPDCIEPDKGWNDEPRSDIQNLRNETPDYTSTELEDNNDSLEREMDIRAPSYCQEVRDCTPISMSDFFNSVSDGVLYSSSSRSSRASDNNAEEIRLLELENINAQWVKHLAELEEENIYLTQRVSGLEAQLRYLTDAKEWSGLELQHSEYQMAILRDEIRKLEKEIKSQKLDAKQKLQSVEDQWAEVQEECESLGKLNVNLQATTETVVEECSFLQKLVGALKGRTVKMEERCMFLEAEARKCRDTCCASDESKHKLVIDELESKLKDSELERVRLAEEHSAVRMQLQKVPELQNEVLGLRLSLKEMKSRMQLLEASLKSASKGYEQLKQEHVFMVEKISCMSKAVSEAEDCKRKKDALEEKVLRLEGDLVGKDQLCVREAEIKHELGRMKLVNSQLVMKVKHLEDRRRLAEDSHGKSTSETSPLDFELEDQINLSGYPLESNEHTKVQDNHSQIQNNVQVLADDLGEALKASNIYKLQSKSVDAVGSKESESKETINSPNSKHKISQLEDELQQICERYLQMSLNYAQVEAQREGLVMKLKALGS